MDDPNVTPGRPPGPTGDEGVTDLGMLPTMDDPDNYGMGDVSSSVDLRCMDYDVDTAGRCTELATKRIGDFRICEDHYAARVERIPNPPTPAIPTPQAATGVPQADNSMVARATIARTLPPPPPLPYAAEVRAALAELERGPQRWVPGQPRPEGVETFRFVLEVDAFGFIGDDRAIVRVAQDLAVHLHRAMTDDQYRLWTSDGRRVVFDSRAWDGEHEGHDVPVLIVQEPH